MLLPLLLLLGVIVIKILAVDQSRSGGWSIFEYETKQLLSCGTFCFDSKTYTFPQAINEIMDLLESVIKREEVSAIFIEDIQLRKNPDSFKKLAMLQGVLISYFEKNEYLYDLIPPSRWQSYCNARGRTSKEVKSGLVEAPKKKESKNSKVLSIQYVKEKYGIDTKNDNLSDAICIGDFVVNNVIINNVEESK